MKSKILALFFLALMGMSPGLALSDNCVGAVTNLVIYFDGGVAIVIGGYGWWPLCNVSQAYANSGFTTPAETCKAWVASLQAAQRAGTNVVITHNASCNVASWTNPGIWAVNTNL